MKKWRLIVWVLMAGLTAIHAEGEVDANQLIELCVYNDSLPNDTTYYASFPDALKEANKADSSSMKLLGDVGFEGAARTQTIRKSMTIDLNGYSLGDTLSSTPSVVNLFYLGTDSITVRFTSSRPGARLWVRRNHNGRIYALTMQRGLLLMDHLTIDALNTADTMSNASASCLGIWAEGVLRIADCSMRAKANGSASGITSSGNAESAAVIDVSRCAIEVEADKNSYGISAYGMTRIDSCDINMHITGNGAHGIHIQACDSALGLSRPARITHSKVRITAGKQAYGINTKWHTNLENDTVEVETIEDTSYGLLTDKDTCLCTARNCSFRGEAGWKSAHGVYVQRGALEAEDCFFRGISRQDTVTVPTESNTRAIFAGKNARYTLHRCSLFAQAPKPNVSKGVIAASSTSTSSLTLTDCLIQAKGEQSVTGIYTTGDNASVTKLNLSQCTIEIQADKNTYGVNATGPAHIENCDIHIQNTGESVYGININSCNSSLGLSGPAHISNSRIQLASEEKAHGISAKWDAELLNDTITVQTDQNTAYGLLLNNDSCHYHASQCSSRTEAGGIYSYGAYIQNGTFVAEDCYFQGVSRQDTVSLPAECNARGVTVSTDSNATLHRCTVIGEGTNRTAAKGAVGLSAGTDAHIVIQDCDIRAEGTEGTSGVRGAGNASSATDLQISDCTIRAKGKKSTYGVNACRTTDVTRSEIEVIADSSTAYGIYLNKYIDSLLRPVRYPVIRQTRISVSTGIKGYGLMSRNNTRVEDCEIEVNARESEAYGTYVYNDNDTLVIQDTKIKTNAPDKSLIVNKNASMVGKLFFIGGYYSNDENLRSHLPEGYSVYRLYDEPEVRAGYNYVIRPTASPDAVVARIYDGQTKAFIGNHKSLASALWYTYLNTGRTYTIVVVGDCALEEGRYLIPDYVTLTIGYRDDQDAAIGPRARRYDAGISKAAPSFACLTMTDGVEMIVEGVLELSALQLSGTTVCGGVAPDQGYGRIHLAPDASISIEPGASLHAWGFITGKGTVIARPGSKIYEFMQIGGWKGGSVTFEMINNKEKVFPISHFFYHNIECPVEYHAGCKAYGAIAAKVGEFMVSYDDIMIIDNENALFVMDSLPEEDYLIRKEYDPRTDYTIWTIYGHATLDKINIVLNTGIAGVYTLVSSNYVLPLNTNINIRVQSGTLEIHNDVMVPPGAVVEVAPGARVHIPENVHVYACDADQYSVYKSHSSTMIPYSPSWETNPRDTCYPDARIEVCGEVLIDGTLFVTEGGAEIIGCDSTEGRITFTNGAEPDGTLYQIAGNNESHPYIAYRAKMAMLMNEDGTYTSTGNAKEGAVYTCLDGYWFSPDTITGTDSIEAVTRPREDKEAKLIIHNNTIYIITRDGRAYTLAGELIKKEEEFNE